MLRALELARKGKTAPNPMVGAVLVKKDKIIAEGFHPYAGGPHAEIVALEQAGSRSHGAELYASLEPCNHIGRTGPCVVALIEAGIKRGVVGSIDSNPKKEYQH